MAEKIYENKQMKETEIVTEKDSVAYIFKEGSEPKEAEYSEIIVSKGGAYGKTTE